VIDVGTVVWMLGLAILAGAIGWALGGPCGAVGAVGAMLSLEGMALDLYPPSPRSEPARDRARELV
jgi:hypothetical protein